MRSRWIASARATIRRPYEFGAKGGIASTSRNNLVLAARVFHVNPYGGHTLHAQTEQVAILMQDRSPKPTKVFVDLGDRGGDAQNSALRIVHRDKPKGLKA